MPEINNSEWLYAKLSGPKYKPSFPQRLSKESVEPAAKKEPRFQRGEIVYLKYSPDYSLNDTSYPMVRGRQEIDCKILDVKIDVFGIRYDLITGKGLRLRVAEAQLLKPSEVLHHKAATEWKLKDACILGEPVLPPGTIFYSIDEWIINEDFGIYFHVSYFEKHLKQLFDVIPGTSL